MGNPKILNLDEIELTESDIVIVHDGEKHHMRVLDVDAFIKQQKSQVEYDRLAAKGDDKEDEGELVNAVEVMKDSIAEFFPSLPVGALPTPKLFKIFVWLNEMTAKLNEMTSSDVVDETQGEAGNEPSETPKE